MNLASSSIVQDIIVESKLKKKKSRKRRTLRLGLIIEESNLGNVIDNKIQEIVEEEEPEKDFKNMKDHIDLDSQAKKTSSSSSGGRPLI